MVMSPVGKWPWTCTWTRASASWRSTYRGYALLTIVSDVGWAAAAPTGVVSCWQPAPDVYYFCIPQEHHTIAARMLEQAGTSPTSVALSTRKIMTEVCGLAPIRCEATNTQWFSVAPFAHKGRWRNFHVFGALSLGLNFNIFWIFLPIFLLCC